MKSLFIFGTCCLLLACVPAKKPHRDTPLGKTGEIVQETDGNAQDAGADASAAQDSTPNPNPAPSPTSTTAPVKSLKFDTQSCEKNPASGTCYTIDARLNELSGIAAHTKVSNVFWVHNDEGPGMIYALNSKGEILVNLTLAGSTFLDSEDLTSGPGPVTGTSYIYLGDIGSNGKSAGLVRVHRFVEPMVDPNVKALNAAAVDVVSLTLAYPGTTLLDFETLFIDPVDGHLFIVQKGGFNVFKADKTQLNAAANGGTVPMTLVRTTGGWEREPSGGNMSPSGDEIILRNETTAWLFRRGPGQKVEDALGTIAATFALGPEFNGEAIAFDNKGIDLVTVSENQSKSANAPSPPQPVFLYKRLP